MDAKVTTWDGEAAGEISLSPNIFGLEPRGDILNRMVRYQLAKRRAGTHHVKTRAELAATGKKFVRQKGSGGARHGDRKAPQFRGGGKAFGPNLRDHGHDLPKKIRALALRHALSAKAQAEQLIVVEDIVSDGKTKALRKKMERLGVTNALVIGGASVNDAFKRASRNIPNIDVLPVAGINVYDILRRERLVLTRAAVEAIEGRLR